jgi:hypothetical protein
MAIVAGPKIGPRSLHAATVANSPNCGWEGGEQQRLETRNWALLRKHFNERAVPGTKWMPEGHYARTVGPYSTLTLGGSQWENGSPASRR